MRKLGRFWVACGCRFALGALLVSTLVVAAPGNSRHGPNRARAST